MDVLLALYATIGLGLEVEAPFGCITALELEAAVEGEIGPFIANAHVRIEKLASGWRAHINRSRTIEESHRDCRALDRALVLEVGLLAERPRVEPIPPPPAPPRDEDQIATIRFGLDAAIAVGALPDPAPGARVSGGVGFPIAIVDLWIEAGFTGWRPSEMMVSEPSQTIESSTDRFDADLSLCAIAPLDRAIEIGGCTGARFGRLSVGGEVHAHA